MIVFICLLIVVVLFFVWFNFKYPFSNRAIIRKLNTSDGYYFLSSNDHYLKVNFIDYNRMRIGDSLDARWVCVLNKKGVAKKVANSISIVNIWGNNCYILIAEDGAYLKVSWEQFQFINWDNKEVKGRWK